MLKTLLKKNWPLLAATLAITAITSVMGTISPYFYGKIIDEVIPKKDMNTLILYVVIIVGIPIIKSLFDFLSAKISFNFSNNCENALRQKYFNSSLKVNYPYIEKQSVPKLVAVLNRDIPQLAQGLLGYELIMAVSGIVTMVVIFTIVATYNVWVAISTFIVVPLFYVIIHAAEKKIRVQGEMQKKVYAEGEAYLFQTFSGMKTIREFGGQPLEMQNYEKWLQKNRDALWTARRNDQTVRMIVPTAIIQLILGIVYIVGARLIMGDKLTIGALVVFVSYVPQLANTVKMLMFVRLNKAEMQSVIDEFEKIDNEEYEKLCNHEHGCCGGHDQIPEVEDDFLKMENVKFSYDREGFELTLDDFRVNKGDFISIVGTTGSGKSSVMDIIECFYPISEGEVLISGKNLNDWAVATLRNMISLSSQSSFLFNDTIRNNISYPGKPDEEKICKVVKEAQLEDFIKNLPDGLDTKVEGYGENFSGGERQRIALARALYRDAPVLLLDEPTAALDADTSRKIFDMVKEKNHAGKTIIMITHDAIKAAYAQKIVVIDDGKVSESGSPETLLNNNGRYRELYESQKKQK